VPVFTLYGAAGLTKCKEYWGRRWSSRVIIAGLICFFFVLIWFRELYVHLNNLYLVS